MNSLRSPDTCLTAQVKATAFCELGRHRSSAANEPVTEIAAPPWSDTILHRAKEGPPTVRMEAWRQVASADTGTVSTSCGLRLWSPMRLLLDILECLRRICGSWGAPRPRHLGGGRPGGAFARQSCYGRPDPLMPSMILGRPIWGGNSPQPPPRQAEILLASAVSAAPAFLSSQLLKSHGTFPRAPAGNIVTPLDAEGPSHGRHRDTVTQRGS